MNKELWQLYYDEALDEGANLFEAAAIADNEAREDLEREIDAAEYMEDR